MKYIDADALRIEIKRQADLYQDTYTDGMRDNLLSFIDSLQQEPDKNLEEVAEKYRRASCNAAMKPNIDGPTPEYIGNIKTAFIDGAEWMKNQFEHCGTFPIEDSRGGYWPTDYYVKKK